MEPPAILATIDPDNYSANTYKTDVIDMKLFEYVDFILQTGELGSGTATCDLTIYSNASNSSSGGTAITGKSTTVALFSGSGTAGGDDKQAIIRVTAADVRDAVASGRYVYAELVVASAACDAAVIALGYPSRYGPPQDYDLSSVAEIIN
jgi:hypothetical protein